MGFHLRARQDPFLSDQTGLRQPDLVLCCSRKNSFPNKDGHGVKHDGFSISTLWRLVCWRAFLYCAFVIFLFFSAKKSRRFSWGKTRCADEVHLFIFVPHMYDVLCGACSFAYIFVPSRNENIGAILRSIRRNKKSVSV